MFGRSDFFSLSHARVMLNISSFTILEGFTIQQKHSHDLVFNSTVNFRGSLGFGQTSLHTLPGNIGTQDVQDVMVS